MTLNKNGDFMYTKDAEMLSPAFSISANTSSCLSLDWIMQTEVEAQFYVILKS